MGHHGFTLAEVLIALAILGVIATFTIPKVLNAQKSEAKNSAAMEVASMLSGAFQAYQLDNEITATTINSDLTHFFNYVSVDTVSVIDNTPLNSSLSCAVEGCVKLHNGGVVLYCRGCPTSGVANTNALKYIFDPDGSYSGSTTGEGKSVMFYLYVNGRITSRAHVLPGTVHHTDAPAFPNPALDPDWLKW